MAKYSEETYQLIEDFINHELSADKANKVRQRIKEDPAFAKEVEWMRSFSSSVEELGDKKKIEVLDAFKGIHTATTISTATNTETPTPTSKPLLKGALLLLPLLLAGLLWFTNANNNAPQNTPTIEQKAVSPAAAPVEKKVVPEKPITPPVAIEQQKPEVPTPKKVVPKKPIKEAPRPTPKKTVPAPKKKVVVETPKPLAQAQPPVPWEQYITYKDGLQFLSGEDSALDKGLIHLDKGEKKEAVPFLEEYLAKLSKEDDDFEIRLETGKIYLEELKIFEKALATFQRVQISDAIPEFTQEADFYVAISYLAKGDMVSAKQQLQQIVDTEGHTWQAKAVSLLDKLGK